MAVYPVIKEVNITPVNTTTQSNPTAFIPITSNKGEVGSCVNVSGGDLQGFMMNFGSVPPTDHPEMWTYAYKAIEAGMSSLVCRIANGTPVAASCTYSESSTALITATANSVGTWGNSYKVLYTSQLGSLTKIIIQVYEGSVIVETMSGSMLSTDSDYIENLESSYLTYADAREGADKGIALSTVLTMSVASSLSNGSNGTAITVSALTTSPTTPDTGILEAVSDRLQYEYSYLTAGGYIDTTDTAADVTNTTKVLNKLISVATTRGDCLALVDDYNFGSATKSTAYYNGTGSTISPAIVGSPSSPVSSSYAACFEPYCKYTNPVSDGTIWMVPSLAFLIALARSQSANPIWYAVAGPERGLVPEVKDMYYQMTGSIVDTWQGDQGVINPIITMTRYGTMIYGQRTLNRSYGSALSGINVRLLVNEVKKKISDICIGLAYNQYSQVTWDKFYSQVTDYLSYVKENSGISTYTVSDLTTAADQNNQIVRAGVSITPLRAAEQFYIELTIDSTSATIVQ